MRQDKARRKASRAVRPADEIKNADAIDAADLMRVGTTCIHS